MLALASQLDPLSVSIAYSVHRYLFNLPYTMKFRGGFILTFFASPSPFAKLENRINFFSNPHSIN